MASLLRQIVASPRARHPEAGLDLCYVTDFIIATSGPSATYPQVAYRNPLKDLVKFLDSKHGSSWAIWEFRAEGTGYPDEEVYGRVHHYPWPDHHPPPFKLIPLIMASMRNWLKDENGQARDGRVVVVHCKAGKGRSGTVSCSYLISEEGWAPEEAMTRFTERRMRPGFGNGVSIPSQRRWISYVDRWTKSGKTYVERPVEILELHVWGLRDGVKIAIEGFVEEGKVIKKFHTFRSSEREVVRGKIRSDTGFANVAMELMGNQQKGKDGKPDRSKTEQALNDAERSVESDLSPKETNGGDVIFRPSSRVVLPTSDVNIDVERRNKTRYGGFTMVTSVGHVWFNSYFEGKGPEQNGAPDDSGVFEIEWDAMDGIKGSSRKGTRAFDKVAVVWKAVDVGPQANIVINEPPTGEKVQETAPADWRGPSHETASVPKLGLRPDTTESAEVSRASSMHSAPRSQKGHGSEEELQGVRPCGPGVEGELNADTSVSSSDQKPTQRGSILSDQPLSEQPGQLDGEASVAGDVVPDIPTSELPDGQPEEELKDHKDHSIGHVKLKKNSETSS